MELYPLLSREVSCLCLHSGFLRDKHAGGIRDMDASPRRQLLPNEVDEWRAHLWRHPRAKLARKGIGCQRFGLGDLERILVDVEGDPREEGCKLLLSIFQHEGRACSEAFPGQVRPLLANQVVQFAHVRAAKGCGVEAPRWLEHAPDFGERARQVRDVIEHVISKHGVEAGVRKGQRLNIRDQISETLFAKVLTRLLQHAWREVRQSDLPACRNARPVAAPQPAWPAAHFEQFGVLVQRWVFDHFTLDEDTKLLEVGCGPYLLTLKR